MLTPKRILAPVSATLASALMVSISAGPAPAASEESIVLHADDVPERASSTSRVSVNGRGTQGNGESWSTSTLSASGRHVAFASEASNLVPRDTNRRSDVFVHDRVTATTKRISVSSRGRQSNGQMTDWPSISPGGRFVGFSSDASTLVRRNTHGDLHAYVRDLATGRTRLISVSSRRAARQQLQLRRGNQPRRTLRGARLRCIQPGASRHQRVRHVRAGPANRHHPARLGQHDRATSRRQLR